MKILVCFKVTPEMENLSIAEVKAIRNGINPFLYARHTFGGYDEAALECALQLRDTNQHIQLDAVTVGPCQKLFFTTLHSLSFDQVVQIQTGDGIDFSPLYVAHILANFVQKQSGYDLILTGQQVGPGESSRIPGSLAGLLGIPCLSHVVHLNLLADEHLQVCCHKDNLVENAIITPPAICAMENALHPYLRISTLKERVKANKKEALQMSTGVVEQKNWQENPRELFAEEREGHCRFIQGDFEQQVKSLIHVIEERKG